MAKERNPPRKDEQEEKETWFSMETYLPLDELQNFLDDNIGGKIRHYAYILHDKDDNENHVHLVLNTRNKEPLERVRNWFYRYDKDEGYNSGQNTLGQVLKNASAMEKYLTHSDRKSQEIGKHQYDPKDIVCDSSDWYIEALRAKGGNQRTDQTIEIIESIARGDTYRSMIERFGRDFVINYRHYQTMAQLMTEEESEVNPYATTDSEIDAIGERDSKSVAILDGLISTIA